MTTQQIRCTWKRGCTELGTVEIWNGRTLKHVYCQPHADQSEAARVWYVEREAKRTGTPRRPNIAERVAELGDGPKVQ